MFRRFLFALVVLAASLGAAAQEAPDALVKRTADEILAIVRQDKDIASGNQQKVVQLAEQKVLPYFDFERMTRLAVGRSWQQATPEQRQALVNAFRTMLVRTYSSSLHQYRSSTGSTALIRDGSKGLKACEWCVIPISCVPVGSPSHLRCLLAPRVAAGQRLRLTRVKGARAALRTVQCMTMGVADERRSQPEEHT